MPALMKHSHQHLSATKPRSPRFGYVSLLQRHGDVVLAGFESTLAGRCALEAGLHEVT